MSDQQFYEDHDAEEILRIANRDSVTGGMSRDKLLQTAAELGISADAVERAEKQLVKKRESDRLAEEDALLRSQFQKERRSKFWSSMWGYIVTNAFMVGIWAVTGMHYFWPIWVMLGWGISILSELYSTFFDRSDATFQRWKRRRERKGMGSKDLVLRAAPILAELSAAGNFTKEEAIRTLRDRLSYDARDAKDVADQYASEHPDQVSTGNSDF